MLAAFKGKCHHCGHDHDEAPAPATVVGVTDELAAFKEAHASLDLLMAKDAWDRDCFYHPFVNAIWEGWRARAALTALTPPPVRDGEGQ